MVTHDLSTSLRNQHTNEPTAINPTVSTRWLNQSIRSIEFSEQKSKESKRLSLWGFRTFTGLPCPWAMTGGIEDLLREGCRQIHEMVYLRSGWTGRSLFCRHKRIPFGRSYQEIELKHAKQTQDLPSLIKRRAKTWLKELSKAAWPFSSLPKSQNSWGKRSGEIQQSTTHEALWNGKDYQTPENHCQKA